MSTPTPPEGPPGWTPPGSADVPPAGAYPPAGPPYGAPGVPPYGGPAPGYGAPGAPQYGVAPGYGYQVARPNHPQAMTALILGIVAWFACPLCGIPAFIIGRKAQKEIDANPTVYDGRGLAMAGWIIGLVAMIISILTILFIIFVFVIAAGTATTTS